MITSDEVIFILSANSPIVITSGTSITLISSRFSSFFLGLVSFCFEKSRAFLPLGPSSNLLSAFLLSLLLLFFFLPLPLDGASSLRTSIFSGRCFLPLLGFSPSSDGAAFFTTPPLLPSETGPVIFLPFFLGLAGFSSFFSSGFSAAFSSVFFSVSLALAAASSVDFFFLLFFVVPSDSEELDLFLRFLCSPWCLCSLELLCLRFFFPSLEPSPVFNTPRLVIITRGFFSSSSEDSSSFSSAFSSAFSSFDSAFFLVVFFFGFSSFLSSDFLAAPPKCFLTFSMLSSSIELCALTSTPSPARNSTTSLLLTSNSLATS